MILAPILTAAEIMINPLLKSDESTMARLSILEGKILQINIPEWNISYAILFHKEGIQLLSKIDEINPHCTITGKLVDLCLIFGQKAANPALFKQNIQIEGDMNLAENLREIMQKIDIDWAGLSSNVLGDMLGTTVANHISQITHSAKEICQTMQLNTTEYLQAEARILPAQREVERFYNDVAILRDDVERIQARIDFLAAEIENK